MPHHTILSVQKIYAALLILFDMSYSVPLFVEAMIHRQQKLSLLSVFINYDTCLFLLFIECARGLNICRTNSHFGQFEQGVSCISKIKSSLFLSYL